MSESATKLSLRISRRLSQHAFKNLLPLQAAAGVVSFTFDDAPASACQTGALILEQQGVRGSFYIAGGLTDALEQGKPCHSKQDLLNLLENGHELGCHGFSHVRCDTLTAVALQRELDRNSAFLSQLGVDTTRLNFAYPFGAFAYNAKRITSARFRSSRITGGGTHIGLADLNALKTHRLYDVAVDADDYESLLARTAHNQGWLIVNTHDVEQSPSRFGTTPQRLEQAIAAALASGCQVLTMNAAIDYWSAAANQVAAERGRASV